MAGKVFFSVSMSRDGFIAPESLEDLMRRQWMELQQWIFPQRFFRENLKLGEGGEEGRDNDIVRETFERTGATVMGKRMFDAGEHAWPEEAPFHTPVFVVTHEKRDPWERPGGTTFHFVNDGIETALDQAREAAGDRDVRVAGGGATILEYVNAGLIAAISAARSSGRDLTGCRGTSSPAQVLTASESPGAPAPAPPVSRWRSSSSNQHRPGRGPSTHPTSSRWSVPARYSSTASSSTDPTNQRVVISKPRDTPIHRS